ncbi:MAG: amidohydrolase, partial [Candidatus Kapaibacteriota bacterium]
SMPDLKNAKSEQECAELVLQKPFHRGNWIIARGWNQENWSKKSFPTKKTLDKIFPNTPICLIRNDGHSLWLNSKALEICKINQNTPEPKGGKIVKDLNGEPTGILIDEAIELVRSLLPPYSKEQCINFLQASTIYLAQHGITTIHDMDVDPKNLDIYQEYFNNDNPKLNTYVFISGKKLPNDVLDLRHYNSDFLKVIGLKYYMDGALGSYGALLFEPYKDNPNSSGLQLLSEEELLEIFDLASESNLGLSIHAIGDKATHIILKTYEHFIQNVGKLPKFLRIEHCQVVRPDDLPKFNKMGIAASIQPIHFPSDFEMAKKRLDNRQVVAYPWKSLQKNNVLICSGSDFPIETPDPIAGLYSFLNRNLIDTEKIFGSEEIDIQEALSTYTINPWLSIKETPCNLESGFNANLTILSGDLSKFPKEHLSVIKVLASISQGNIIYQS